MADQDWVLVVLNALAPMAEKGFPQPPVMLVLLSNLQFKFMTGNVVRAYKQQYVDPGLQAIGIHCWLSNFKDSYSLFAFDLTPDRTPEEARINLLHQAKFNSNLKFGTALPHPVSVIIYAVYDNRIQLTADRIPVSRPANS